MSGTNFFVCSTSAISALFCCAQNFSLSSCPRTVAKRTQEQKRTRQECEKSKPMARNLTSTVSTSSSSVNHPIASKIPGILKASTGKPDVRTGRNSKPDAASSSQGRVLWRNLPRQTKVKNHGSYQEIQRVLKLDARNGHIIFMSPAVVPHMDKVYPIARQIYGRSPTDDLGDIDVTPLYGTCYERHTSSRSSSWTRLNEEFALYQETTPEVCETAIPSDPKSWLKIRKKSASWPRLITKKLRGDRRVYYVTKLLKLRMPKPMSSPTRCPVWEAQESRWNSNGKYSQDSLHWASSKRFKNMTEVKCEPQQFKDRIIFMSMYNDIVWREPGNTEVSEKSNFCCALCSQIPARTMVILGTCFREEVVRHLFW